MNAKIIDGKKIASEIKEELRQEVEKLKNSGICPGLAVIIIGNDPASEVYVKSKKKTALELGMNSWVYELEENISQEEVFELIKKLNEDKNVHGILVQLPLPKHLDEEAIIESINPQKDVDCFHPENVGRLAIGIGKLLSCTPAGIIELLKRENVEIVGKNCVVIGRSNIVGKPLSLMLINKNATVTVCHSRTFDLASHTKKADILISAAGKPGLITADMVRPGALVIDVGINRKADGKLTGDVDFEKVKEVADAITPVPGGVGPMTIIMLMKNTIKAAKILNACN